MTLRNHWRDEDVPYEHGERTLDTLMILGNQRSHQEIHNLMTLGNTSSKHEIL